MSKSIHQTRRHLAVSGPRSLRDAERPTAFGGEEVTISTAKEPERGRRAESPPLMVAPVVRQTLQLVLHKNTEQVYR